jgi:hypothetical protein
MEKRGGDGKGRRTFAGFQGLSWGAGSQVVRISGKKSRVYLLYPEEFDLHLRHDVRRQAGKRVQPWNTYLAIKADDCTGMRMRAQCRELL